MSDGLSRKELADLEGLLDRVGMCEILDSLATIAAEKADHIRGNWQDTSLAICWDDAAAKLEALTIDSAIASIDRH